MRNDNVKMDNTINIVFAADSNYAQHATVAMISIIRHTKSQERLRFFVLADNIPKTTKEKMKLSVIDKCADIVFVDIDAAKISKYYVSGQLSRTAYARLEMAKWLPADIDKVIYLDCDLIVFSDIVELWDYDLEDKPLGAVPDYGIMTSHKDFVIKQKTLAMQVNDSYFNSGVLVLSLAKWRKNNYTEKLQELVVTNNYQHHDQDALNKLFYNNWQSLPLRWNIIPPVWQLFQKILWRAKFRRRALEARKNIAILHYAGGYKPWEYKPIADFNLEYYRSWHNSAFCNEVMPRPNPNRKRRSIKRQLWRIRLADFWQMIFTII